MVHPYQNMRRFWYNAPMDVPLPDGYQYCGWRDGYRLVRKCGSGRSGKQYRAHRVIWESVHGPIPEGSHIHHRNGERADNRLENLELVTPLEHRRARSGCKLVDGVWCKPCRQCGQRKPYSDFYFYKQTGLFYRCKRCATDAAIVYQASRPPKRKQHHMAKLSREDVATIKRRLADGHSCYMIAKDYPVGAHAILSIRDGRSWSYVEAS